MRGILSCVSWPDWRARTLLRTRRRTTVVGNMLDSQRGWPTRPESVSSVREPIHLHARPFRKELGASAYQCGPTLCLRGSAYSSDVSKRWMINAVAGTVT